MDMFKELLEKFEWTPIQGCPGRYLLAKGVIPDSIQELIGPDIVVTEEHARGARDPVCICHFSGGGMISYRKDSGYLHTLCSEEGMRRKLAMLKK